MAEPTGDRSVSVTRRARRKLALGAANGVSAGRRSRPEEKFGRRTSGGRRLSRGAKLRVWRQRLTPLTRPRRSVCAGSHTTSSRPHSADLVTAYTGTHQAQSQQPLIRQATAARESPTGWHAARSTCSEPLRDRRQGSKLQCSGVAPQAHCSSGYATQGTNNINKGSVANPAQLRRCHARVRGGTS